MTNAEPNSSLFFRPSTVIVNYPTSDMTIVGTSQTTPARICLLDTCSSLHKDLDKNRWNEWATWPKSLADVPQQELRHHGLVAAFVNNPSHEPSEFIHYGTRVPIDYTLLLDETCDYSDSCFAFGPFVRTFLNEPEPIEALFAKASLQLFAPKASSRIEHLMRLESNWDGYGGLQITAQAIQIATQILLQVHRLTKGELKLPFIAPQPDGGFELEWIQDSGKELTLVVSADSHEVEYLLDIPSDGGTIQESEGVLQKDALLSTLIARLD